MKGIGYCGFITRDCGAQVAALESAVKLSDQRLEEIRAWLCGESKQDPSMRQEEMAAIAGELKQLRMRTSSASRSASAPPRAAGH
jgi:hypothetical protein